MRKLSLLVTCALLVGACPKSEKPSGAKGQKTTTNEKKATAAKKTADEPAAAPAKIEPAKKVELKTSLGSIVVELNAEKAPISAANFTRYVKQGHYDGTIFHRVIKTFMIQGGGFDTNKKKKPTLSPIQNEADNGLKNKRGTLAMARTRNPHSASAQFFINVVDNAFLDHREKSLRGWGYTVFGKVVEGMDVVDKIKAVPVKNEGGPFANMPQPAVVIEKATVLE